MIKTKIKTKEELIREVAKQETELVFANNKSDRIRKEFAKTFGWVVQSSYDPYRYPGLSDPSWEQIFVEIGKLLASGNLGDFERNVSQLRMREENLEEKAKKEQPQ